MPRPSSTTSNAQIARTSASPAGGGVIAASAASRLLDDGHGIACVGAPCIPHDHAPTNVNVLMIRSTSDRDRIRGTSGVGDQR